MSNSKQRTVFPPPDQTRLVTIVAQVDHGKTTMADSLIESNGIISERLAGTLRYLDSMEEEQRRGITMRTSAIGLRHLYQKNAKDDKKEMVIHLLDSPGHTDFAPEVSSALQCCDGALLVVDAVEGMCARTHQVLREAHAHQLVPILVLNKIDRLCCELCLSPTEAYFRLRGLMESVNAASAAMLNSIKAEEENNTNNQHDDEETEEEALWTFDPAKGNVVFASALFGWGFSIQGLAKSLFRQKTLPLKPVISKQYLFGDYKYKDGKMLKWKGESDDVPPLFAEFALKPIWDLYEAVSNASMILGLGSDIFKDGRAFSHVSTINENVKIGAKDLGEALEAMSVAGTGTHVPKTESDLSTILSQTGASAEETVLRSLLRRYRPLSEAVLDAVCAHCPAPDEAASKVRTRALALKMPTGDINEEFQRIQRSVASCRWDGPLVAHICKFLSADRTHVRDPEIDSSVDSMILGLARVLSGTLKVTNSYFCMGPKHKASDDAPSRSVRLYLLMGNSFVPVREVPAGHLCAVYGLEDLQLKTVTLCDSQLGMQLMGFDRGIRPLVKVNVEPEMAEDTEALASGLMKLSMADAAVEVTATSKGERILACLGEIHLEQSILDLKAVYCGKKDMKLRISEPIVDFAETTGWFEGETSDYAAFFDSRAPPLRQTTMPPYNEEEGIALARHGRMRSVFSGRGAALSLRVVPLDPLIHASLVQGRLLEGSEEAVEKLANALGARRHETTLDTFSILLDSLVTTNNTGSALVESKGLCDGRNTKGVIGEEVFLELSVGEEQEELLATNEDKGDANATLTGKIGEDEFMKLQQTIRSSGLASTSTDHTTSPEDVLPSDIWKSQLRGSLVAGFQAGVRSGPICEESVQSVLVVIEGFELALKRSANQERGALEPSKPLNGGMVVSALRRGIRCCILSRPVRLVEGHLKLTLHSSLTGLGPLYAVLSKRRGRVLEESMVEGTDLILITATLPQAESFSLTPELLQKTSGEVTVPELTFMKWSVLEEDPFWIPTSLEEREDYGEIVVNGDLSTGLDNTALKYIRQVRDRKGLLVDSNKTVVAGCCAI